MHKSRKFLNCLSNGVDDDFGRSSALIHWPRSKIVRPESSKMLKSKCKWKSSKIGPRIRNISFKAPKTLKLKYI
jgi:hypothetical protein